MASYSMHSVAQPCRSISLKYPHGFQLSFLMLIPMENFLASFPFVLSFISWVTSSNGSGEHQRKVMLLVTIVSQTKRRQTFQYFMQNAKILAFSTTETTQAYIITLHGLTMKN